MANTSDKLSALDKAEIVKAIKSAEKKTSGEIQVHVDKHCKEDVLDRAAHVFKTLKMHETKERNGVLFYLAIKDHKFAILELTRIILILGFKVSILRRSEVDQRWCYLE